MKPLESTSWAWQNPRIVKYWSMLQRMTDMIVITADLDFGDILAFTGYKKPSVIIFRLKEPSPDHINSLLLSAIPRITDALNKGSIVVIEDYRIRIRELPVT